AHDGRSLLRRVPRARLAGIGHENSGNVNRFMGRAAAAAGEAPARVPLRWQGNKRHGMARGEKTGAAGRAAWPSAGRLPRRSGSCGGCGSAARAARAASPSARKAAGARRGAYKRVAALGHAWHRQETIGRMITVRAVIQTGVRRLLLALLLGLAS